MTLEEIEIEIRVNAAMPSPDLSAHDGSIILDIMFDTLGIKSLKSHYPANV